MPTFSLPCSSSLQESQSKQIDLISSIFTYLDLHSTQSRSLPIVIRFLPFANQTLFCFFFKLFCRSAFSLTHKTLINQA